jgi:hypothetical protein
VHTLTSFCKIVLQSMRTDIVIEGQAVTVAVSQTYTNQGNKPLEVVFSMGLGPMAVTGLECERDGVVVAGEIKPSAKARDDYDDSISMGHTASLGEYNSEKRTFEMSLGNLTMGSSEHFRSFLCVLSFRSSADCANQAHRHAGRRQGVAVVRAAK